MYSYKLIALRSIQIRNGGGRRLEVGGFPVSSSPPMEGQLVDRSVGPWQPHDRPRHLTAQPSAALCANPTNNGPPQL